MTQFKMFRDQVGAEVYSARTTRKEVVGACGGKLVRFVPVELRPVEVVDPKSVAGRVAGGFLLAGPVGAAIGALSRKGPTVRFEVLAADGTTYQGVIEQDRFPALRRSIEQIQAYQPGDGRRALAQWAIILPLVLVFVAAMGPLGILAALGSMAAIGAFRDWRRSKVAKRRA